MIRRVHISFALLALLAAGCAHNIVDVPPPSGFGASSYGWNLEKPVTYTTEQANSTIKSSVALRFVATSQPGIYLAVETYPSLSDDTLLLHSSSDSLAVSGLTERSVIKVPTGYALSATKLDTLNAYRPITKIYAFGDAGKQVVAADDSCHVFFSTDGGDSWLLSSGIAVNTSDAITGFIFGQFTSSKAMLLAAMRSGACYASSDGGRSWIAPFSPLKGAITALCTSSNAIYASVVGQGVVELTTSPKLIAQFPQSDTAFTSLAAVTHTTFGQRVSLLAAGSKGGLYFLDSATGKTWRSVPPAKSFASTTVHFVLGTADSSFIFGAQGGSTTDIWTWNPEDDTATLVTSDAYTMAAIDGSTRTNILLANEPGATALLQLPRLSPVRLPLLSNGSYLPVTSVAIGTTRAFAATHDSGIYYYTIQNAPTDQWSHGTHGSPTMQHILHTPIPLELSLLAPPPSGLAVGATWDAGTVTSDSLRLTVGVKAVVARYVDSVKLSNGLTFNNIFVVNYAFADQNGSTANSPVQLTIYFAKGEGPILLDETQEPSGILLSRAYRSSK